MFKKTKPYLIVGLGNPGREYRTSRHNIGFMVLDRLAEELETSFTRVKMNATVTAVRWNRERLILIKPQTFMNLSGQAVSSFKRFYKLPLENILVVYDDVDLRRGFHYSAAGHQGIPPITGGHWTSSRPHTGQ